MKFKMFQFFCLMVWFVFSMFLCGGAFAADPAPEEDPGETEESAFQNPTQAQRAINLVEAYAEKPDPEFEKALDNVEKAEAELEKAKADGDKEEIETAEQALADARDAVDEQMAQNTDVTAEDIGQMRQDGMGWGQIAHQLGLHPSVLGMRHAKAYKEKEDRGKGFGPGENVSDREIKEATAHNFKSGFSKGHGAQADKGGVAGNGKSAGKGQGKAGAKGAGDNKGNNGKGNGNGNGKSK